LLDRLGEQAILAIDRSAGVPNYSVTSYEFDAMRGKNGKLVARLVNSSHPLRDAGAAIAASPDILMPSSVPKIAPVRRASSH